MKGHLTAAPRSRPRVWAELGNPPPCERAFLYTPEPFWVSLRVRAGRGAGPRGGVRAVLRLRPAPRAASAASTAPQASVLALPAPHCSRLGGPAFSLRPDDAQGERGRGRGQHAHGALRPLPGALAAEARPARGERAPRFPGRGVRGQGRAAGRAARRGTCGTPWPGPRGGGWGASSEERPRRLPGSTWTAASAGGRFPQEPLGCRS